MRRLSIALLTATLTSLARAQSSPTITIRGSVVDASSSLPISGAQLTLASVTLAVLPAAGPSPVLTTSRVVSTDSMGNYEVRGVATGAYQLFVRRLGYQPTLIDLDVGDASRDTRLSLGLVVVPVRLEPIRIDGELLNSFGRLSVGSGGADSAVIAAARAREHEFLGSDVRELTMHGSLQSGGTGETDVLRAIRRLPGVTGPDDYSTELWVRGARWDQVRISYDGLPLFNPFHASETVSAISPDAIGAAFLHPGVRPVSLFAQGASLIDVRSRAATDTGRNVLASASRRDLSLAAERARADGTGGYVATFRRSLKGLSDKSLALLPLDHDVRGSYLEETMRVDRQLSNGKSLEFSLLNTHDDATVPAFDAIQSQLPVSSGSTLLRLTLNTATHGLRASHTIGYSGYSTFDAAPAYPLSVVDTNSWGTVGAAPPGGYLPNDARVRYLTVRGDFRPTNSTPSASWNVGYQVARYKTFSAAMIHQFSWSELAERPFSVQAERDFAALWSERRWSPVSRLSVDAGMRVESGLEAVSVRVAPSVQARFRIDPFTHLTLGASRSFEDVQEVPFTSFYRSSSRGFWTLSGRGAPALRADQASIGIDRWLGSSIAFDVNAYARRLSNVAVRPLASGDSLPHPLVLPAETNARGVEVSLRKLAGTLTGSLSYTLGKSTDRVEGVTYPGAGDRRHSIDATAMLRAGSYRFGSAFTWMTGAPYTRWSFGRGYYNGPGSVDWTVLASSETRNAQRLPEFSSLDLFVERFGRIGGAAVTPYFGIQNALNQFNFTEFVPGRLSEGPPDNRTYNGDSMIATRQRRIEFGFRVVF